MLSPILPDYKEQQTGNFGFTWTRTQFFCSLLKLFSLPRVRIKVESFQAQGFKNSICVFYMYLCACPGLYLGCGTAKGFKSCCESHGS